MHAMKRSWQVTSTLKCCFEMHRHADVQQGINSADVVGLEQKLAVLPIKLAHHLHVVGI
jgi:hypothetical protein